MKTTLTTLVTGMMLAMTALADAPDPKFPLDWLDKVSVKVLHPIPFAIDEDFVVLQKGHVTKEFDKNEPYCVLQLTRKQKRKGEVRRNFEMATTGLPENKGKNLFMINDPIFKRLAYVKCGGPRTVTVKDMQDAFGDYTRFEVPPPITVINEEPQPIGGDRAT